MDTYILYVHDARYSAPTMDFLTVASDERACQLAQERLASSPHYRRAEVWRDDRQVCAFDQPPVASD